MGSGLTACVRYLLFFFNLIFALTGIAVLAVGGLCQYILHEHEYSQFMDNIYRYLPAVLLVIGAIVTIVAFFGCCGSYKENHCMLFSFGILLVVLFIVEIAAISTSYVFRDDLISTVEKKMQEGVQNYYEDKDAQKLIDGIQEDLHCCGAIDATEYKATILPNSCCPISEEPCNAASAYQRGCTQAFTQFLMEAGLIFLSIGAGVAVVQLIGIIFAFCLARSIRRGYEIV